MGIDLLRSSDLRCAQSSLKCLREFARDSKSTVPLLLEARLPALLLKQRPLNDEHISILRACQSFVAAVFPDHPLAGSLRKALAGAQNVVAKKGAAKAAKKGTGFCR